MNRRELYAKAMDTVQARRLAAQQRVLQARRALYAAEARFAQLDKTQTDAGALAVRLAADGQMDAARAQLDIVREAGKERDALLKSAGSETGLLQAAYQCKECEDTGRLRGGALCACVEEEARRLRREHLGQTSALRLCRFERFSVEKYPHKMAGSPVSPRATMAAILADCKDYAAAFGPHSPSLYLFGDAGLGKTHLALSIASVVLDKGFDVLYVSAQAAFAGVAAERGSGEDGLFRNMMEADLLVLDDLGTEYLDAWVRSRLYELVNGRMHRRPTIYTSNICRQELLNQRYDEKIASRLLGDCHLMRFWGQDIRLQKGNP